MVVCHGEVRVSDCEWMVWYVLACSWCDRGKGIHRDAQTCDAVHGVERVSKQAPWADRVLGLACHPVLRRGRRVPRRRQWLWPWCRRPGVVPQA